MNYKKIFALVLVIDGLTACKDFEELEIEPNLPTEVPASIC
ncbi:MAG: hypothetical protein QM762_12120 [Chryseolinea sp.]